MSWTSGSRLRALVSALLLILLCYHSHAQWKLGSLKDSTNQADYIAVTSAEYVSAVLPLASLRANEQSLSVAIVLLDSITTQFPRATPDSSLRDFVTRTLTHWRAPHPQFLLLAGNVNVIPSHREASPLAPYTGEDSVMIDQWFVNQLSESQTQQRPGMAIGRFPAWSLDKLSEMVSKTIAYEQMPVSRWASRAIAIADSGDSGFFEGDAATQQQVAARRWQDTITVHIRPGSPFYKTPRQFVDLWNEGSAIVNFVGHMNGWQFSRGAYFTRQDIDSLSASSSMSMCLLGGAQRFEERDTVPIAVALLQAPGSGGVCVIAPSGLVYESENATFAGELFARLSSHPTEAIGTAWLAVEQHQNDVENRRTLFGDPALVIKSGTIASIRDPMDGVPSEYLLFQNFPNPFNPETVIRFHVPKDDHVTLKVYDLLGRVVATLINHKMTAGTHEVKFDATGLSSGVYLYRMQAGEYLKTLKLVVMK